MKKTLKQIVNRGAIMVTVIVFATVAVTVTAGLVNWGSAMLKSVRNVALKEQAFQVAEAGLDYYRWHLAQYPTDFKDGTNHAGPYTHPFYDKDGNLVGTYSLTITPPLIGSTVVKLVSVGTLASSTLSRTLQMTLAIPSLAKYATVANDNMYFGSGTEVFGPIHSNYGIHFNGVSHNLISSSLSTYTDPDTGDKEFAVYTDISPRDPAPPATVPNRPDVFMSGRQFPVPAFDFTGLTASLTTLQQLAISGGKNWTSSQAQGYYMHLNTNDTYDMYKVTAVQSAPNNCSNVSSQTQWGTWSIKTKSSKIGTYAFPANGVIFVADHLWVDGQISTARLTIAAGIIGSTNPSQYSNITVNTNLLYTYYDGRDVLALIAQGNVNSGLYSDNNYRIDAALVADNGRVGRFYYSGYCKVGGINYFDRSSITLYGMIATNKRYGFAYTDDTGYEARNIIYDGNLLYGPPPSFPQATNQYQTISWGEL